MEIARPEELPFLGVFVKEKRKLEAETERKLDAWVLEHLLEADKDNNPVERYLSRKLK